MAFKPYVKKPLVHSPRGDAVLAAITGYLIKTPGRTANTKSPGQALAALQTARANNIRCLIYAISDNILGEVATELVDETFLLQKIGIAPCNTTNTSNAGARGITGTTSKTPTSSTTTPTILPLLPVDARLPAGLRRPRKGDNE